MSYDWKRIASSQHHTVLQHKDGHQLKVAHSSVSPEIRQKIEKFPLKMAYGGSSDVEETSASEQPKEQSKAVPKEGIWEGIKNTFGDEEPAKKDFPPAAWMIEPKKHASGGMINHYAEGGPSDRAQPVEIHNHYYSSPPPQGMAKDQGGIPPYLAANPAPQAPASEPGQNIQMPQAPPQQTAPQATAQPQAPQSGDQFGYQQAIENQMAGLQEQKAGQQQQVAAQGQEAKGRITAEQDALQQQEQAQYSFNQNLNKIHGERMDLQNDIANNHIDPERYLNNMSTGSKIMTGLGLVLGGAGAGLTHGPNLAYEMLQKHISNDIDSQKAEIGKKENLLAHNFQEEGNLRSAMDMTRLQTNDVLSSHLKMEADKAQDPMTKGRLLDLAGKFDMESAQLQQKLALTKTMMGGVGRGGDQESAFQKQMQFLRMQGQEGFAKDQEAKHVPGIGQASKEVPAEVMKEMTSRQDLQNKLHDLQDFAAKNSGSLDPATIRQGQAKAALVQDAYRRANAQGVFKESEKDFVGNIISSDPTQFFNKYRSGKGYKEAGRDNLSSLNNLKKSYGLPAKEEALANPMEGKTAVNPKTGQKIIMRNGEWGPVGQ